LCRSKCNERKIKKGKKERYMKEKCDDKNIFEKEKIKIKIKK